MAFSLHSLPKVELHVHLEGAASLETMAAIYGRHGCAELATPEAVRESIQHRDFASFLQRFRHFLTYLRTPEDYEMLTEAVLRRLAGDGIVYAELTVSLRAAEVFSGLQSVAVLEAIQRGYEAARRDVEIDMGVLVDLIRNLGPEVGWDAARTAAKHRDLGVVGINLGGDEANFPADPYAEVYAYARDQGLGLTAHAGEAAGPESVWACIDKLGVSRIGHGTRAAEDTDLLRALAERGITVEACPTSNVCTGTTGSVREYPLVEFLSAGCKVCINTDDPTFFECTLPEEIAAVAKDHDLSDAQIVNFQRNAIEASFASEATKARLREKLEGASL